MDEEKPKRPRGRPRTYPGTEKRPTLTFRVRGGLHEQLKAAAEGNQRSISEEIEGRIGLSFEPNWRAELADQKYQDLVEFIGGYNSIWSARTMNYYLNSAIEIANKQCCDGSEWTLSSEKKEIVVEELTKMLPSILRDVSGNKGDLATAIGKMHRIPDVSSGMQRERRLEGKK
ncbi:hypothetical protein [Methylobacterium sp. A54F]